MHLYNKYSEIAWRITFEKLSVTVTYEFWTATPTMFLLLHIVSLGLKVPQPHSFKHLYLKHHWETVWCYEHNARIQWEIQK